MDLVKWVVILLNSYIGKDLKLLVFKNGMVVFIIEMVLILIDFIVIINRIDLYMDMKIILILKRLSIENVIF